MPFILIGYQESNAATTIQWAVWLAPFLAVYQKQLYTICINTIELYCSLAIRETKPVFFESQFCSSAAVHHFPRE